jgi:hypothetical protein
MLAHGFRVRPLRTLALPDAMRAYRLATRRQSDQLVSKFHRG